MRYEIKGEGITIIKYLFTQDRSSSMHKANANRHKGGIEINTIM